MDERVQVLTDGSLSIKSNSEKAGVFARSALVHYSGNIMDDHPISAMLRRALGIAREVEP